MRLMMQAHKDEAIRKACFTAREKLGLVCLTEYGELVKLRNEFARLLGYTDFYDYKLRHIDGLTKEKLFAIFGDIATAVRPNFQKIRELEKTKPGLRKPWNFAYTMTGDFIAEEDQYFPFGEAVPRWLESFAKLGVSFAGGKLTLDLVERKGKHNNGFCHWPELVHYESGKRKAGAARFTCNVTPGQVGSGELAYRTLFHEGGHAAHLLNVTQRDVCLNHEYAPMTAAWVETHSMFMDTLYASMEWKSRYARNGDGEVYPIDLFKRKTEATSLLQPGRIMSVVFLSSFERHVYELKNPTAEQIVTIAQAVYREMYDHSGDSVLALTVPHIYSWDSACAYHGYGLAEVALYQWREYFYKKYGYIVDNVHVGREMMVAWSWGSKYDFATAVKKATGKTLNAKALIDHIMRSPKATIQKTTTHLRDMDKAKIKKVPLATTIELVHGKKVIAASTEGFEAMAKRYKEWFATLENGG